MACLEMEQPLVKQLGELHVNPDTYQEISSDAIAGAGVETISLSDVSDQKKSVTEQTKGAGGITLIKEPNLWPNIKRDDIKLPECFKGRLAFVLHNVFSKDRSMPEARNNTRCIWDSVEEATRIWHRIKYHIPAVWKGRKVLGLNERLRFLKYNPGEFFKSHMDGSYFRPVTAERSFITVQLYLNEGFKGGSTTFMNYAEEERREVVPKIGKVLIFQHDIMHEGSMLKKGCKYAVRTDVMYTAEGGYE